MGTFTGKCRYCGEEISIIAESQEDADRQASRDCRCGGYQREQQIAERKEHMAGALMALIAPGCERQNFRPLPKTTKKKLLSNGYKDKENRRCWYTGRPGAERHEIFGGPNRQKSIELGFQVDVCPEIHARLHANCDEWARIENRKWRMYYQTKYEEEMIAEGASDEEARSAWMMLIGRNYL